ncbi:hypothetical protein [Methylorubrum extorquens]|jgi:hypothetical protein
MPATVFLVFLLLGPPIGFAAFAIEMNVAVRLGLISSHSYGGGLPIIPAAIFDAAVVSYLAGGVQALFTGLVALISLGRNAGTRIGLHPVLLASAAPGVAFLLLVGGTHRLDAFQIGLFVMSWHMVAGFGAWLISTMLIRIAGSETTYGPPAPHRGEPGGQVSRSL